MRLQGEIGWSHAYGDLIPTAALAFTGETTPFFVSGVALAEDSLVLGGALEYAMGANSKFSVSYAGEIAGDVQQNAVKGALSVLF